MTSLTERYLEEALHSIPDRQRADVERELRSSIVDAIEDRVAAGEPRADAERSVLEGLGNPSRLSASYTGRPMYLIGPELFPVYWHILPRLAAIVVPVVAVIQMALEFGAGGGYLDAVGAGVSGAIGVGIQLAFWVTATFVLLERVDAAREARAEIVGATGRWTVDMLPESRAGRVTAGETIGEVITSLISIGGLFFLLNLGTVTDPTGAGIPLFDTALTGFWFPVLIGILVAIALLQVVVYVVGRWTIALAITNAALTLGFATPVIVLALSGTLINPDFAEAIDWPPLAEGDGVVMLAVAAGTTLASAWEIVDPFRRARRPSGAVPAGDAAPSTR